MACETRRLSEAFFHSWKTACSSERGFLQSKRWWHYPFSSQLKFIENIQENTARLISSQLACQKQTNTATTRTQKKKEKKRNPSPAFWVRNRHLIRCNDLQYDKSSQIYCDRLNGTQHKYNYSSHDHLHFPPPKEVFADATQRGCGMRSLEWFLLFQFAPRYQPMPNTTNNKAHKISRFIRAWSRSW